MWHDVAPEEGASACTLQSIAHRIALQYSFATVRTCIKKVYVLDHARKFDWFIEDRQKFHNSSSYTTRAFSDACISVYYNIFLEAWSNP